MTPIDHSVTRNRAIETARTWLQTSPLFLDTETTGLGPAHKICQLAVLDSEGRALLDALVYPGQPVTVEAQAVHGLNEYALANALPMEALLDPLGALVRGRQVIVWNAEFDRRLLCQSGAGDVVALAGGWQCAMKLHADWFGDWNAYHGNYRWRRLAAAAADIGLLPDIGHSARGDANLCRQIVKAIAGE